MKPTILITIFLLAGLLNIQAQDNKPTAGDIGLKYALNFNGAIQQQISVSGFVKNNLEFGGTLTFSYHNTNNTANGTSYQEAILTDSILTNANTANKNTNYSLSLSPYLIYHFPLHSNIDLYTGGFVTFGISNSVSNSSTTYTALNFERTNEDIITSPATFTAGAGFLVGCQYFFYKRLAIGVQAGLSFSGSFAKGNSNTNNFEQNSGTNNPEGTGYYSYNVSSLSANNRTINLSTAANAGVTLAFYFARKAKTSIPGTPVF